MSKPPWEDSPDCWRNKAAYENWLRGQLRSIWTHYIPKNEYKDSKCVQKSEVPDKKFHPSTKKVAACEQCGEYFPKSKLDVDHIEEAGKLEYGKEGEFLSRLLCPKSNMRLLCKPCHKIITYATKNGLGFEEARREKELIAFFNSNSPSEQKKFLTERGFCAKQLTNERKRKECYREYSTSQKNRGSPL
jgi:hypothetical protein